MSFFNFNYNFKRESITHEQQRKNWKIEFFKTYMVVCLGYAVMYLVRNNFKAAQPFMKEQFEFTTTDLGWIGLGFSISYGIGRTLIGYFFDGKNTKKILAVLLGISGILAIIIGITLATLGKTIGFLIILWTINGAIQSTGGPCSASTIRRWVTDTRRGTWQGIWNISHNIGGALAGIIALGAANIFFGGNVYGMFIFPGLIALFLGIVGLFIGKGDPRELGWGSIEEIFEEPSVSSEMEASSMSKKEIVIKYIIKNPFIWLLCFANIFVYILRIGVDNWAPLYVTESLNFSGTVAVNTIFFFEIGGFVGSLVWGWISDKLGGRRIFLSVVCLIVMPFAYGMYQTGSLVIVIYISLFLIGLLVFGPISLIGISVIDFAPKQATTVASAIPGTFGYIFGDAIAKVAIARIADPEENGLKIFGRVLHGWNDQFILFYVSIAAAVLLLVFVAIEENKRCVIRKKQIEQYRKENSYEAV
ncbi:hexose-6-phosphate:phosphate antiporter [Priestia aryabhattai]|uniref:hexose-6-phosphate:phosphate antiporter n=1 Tax=Priestia aryabhattai TaxID=412384 RepID=UPI001CCCBB63|nr:hexose-6-phosphate:phosphate antiporter [Priestia aryabhattai]MBZ6485120.1 hexose-6-phosphate:phosphate antiporter [Priestia aryabhattai]